VVLYSALVLIPFLVAPAWEVWLHIDRGPVVFAFGAIYLLVAAFLLFGFISLLVRRSGMPSIIPPVLSYLSLILGLILVASFVFTALFQRDHDTSILLELAGGVGLVAIIYSFLPWVIRWADFRLGIKCYRGHVRPSEVLLIDLIHLSIRASRLGWTHDDAWRFREIRLSDRSRVQRQMARPFIDELEIVAERSERLFYSSIPRRHHDLRVWASDRGRRIAAVLRTHKQVFVEITELPESSISSSLLNGAVSVARGDWEAFLTVQPTPVVQSLVRRFGGRIVLAALLAGGALAIPWLFPSLVPPAAAMGFRLTLLVTAVFSLLQPDLDKAREALISFRQP
jgi:hypothetical protein